MGDHESDGLEYQDDKEDEEEDDEPVHDLTGGGALLSVQLPAATAAPRMHSQTARFARVCDSHAQRQGGQHWGARTYYASHRPRAGFLNICVHDALYCEFVCIFICIAI